MRFRKNLPIVLLAAVVPLCSGTACFADDQSGLYLSVSPGRYVDYFTIGDSGRDVAGYLESIRGSAESPGRVQRVQTFVSAKSTGSVIVFGDRTATRTPAGYTLTYTTNTGQVNQELFVRSTVARVNTAIAELTTSVSRAEARNELNAEKAELSEDLRIASVQTLRLGQGQKNLDAAVAGQGELQRKADASATVARRLRADANAAINTPGANFAQNQKSIAAMKIADDAEQNARIQQHEADAAAVSVTIARNDLGALRANITGLTERARVLTEKLKATDEVAGR